MDYFRRTYEDAPHTITIPANLRYRKVEVIILPLEEKENSVVEVDANGYPLGFFEETAGCLADDPISR